MFSAACVVFLGFTSGCVAAADREASDSPFEAEVITSTETQQVEADKGSIESQLVAALKSACPDLSPFASDASSWVIISDKSAGAPFRMTLDGGDGGYIVLWFTPGNGEANLKIDDEYFDETNTVLFYSGCKTLAENPDLDVEVGAATNSVEVEMFEVPNFVGVLQRSAKSWFGLNSAQVRVQHRFKYGTNPKTSCMVSGDGYIIDQTPRAGTLLENTGSSTVILAVDCEW